MAEGAALMGQRVASPQRRPWRRDRDPELDEHPLETAASRAFLAQYVTLP